MSSTVLRNVSGQLLLVLAMVLGSGCAMVSVRQVDTPDYTAAKRADVLTDGRLGYASQEALKVLSLDPEVCQVDVPACIAQLRSRDGLEEEVRLATLAELWTLVALNQAKVDAAARAGQSPQAVEAWLEAARHAYAYLFFTGRKASERALEDRLTQVRDYYNNAAEQAAAVVFARAREQALEGGSASSMRVNASGWVMSARYDALEMRSVPRSMVAASSIGFAGMRSTYRRDGFGAELVVVMEPETLTVPLTSEPEEGRTPLPLYSQMPAINVTAVLRFDGQTLAEVLSTRHIQLEAYAADRTDAVVIEGQRVPLAANFTAAYGLWLAESGFATQALRTLFGRGEGITEPHIYMMQPYDPNKRVLFLLHGLASSPEAWVNLVNEVTGDKVLREHYQVWSVYYPTNAPLALNRYTISRALNRTLAAMDPAGTAAASHNMVFVGHSMGGILARLMLSQPGDTLMASLIEGRELSGDRLARVQRRLGPVLRYEPQANVTRAVFIAAPHQGTDIANKGIGNFIGKLIRLPLTILGGFADVVQLLADPAAAEADQKPRVPTSIDNLKATDPFIRAAAGLPLRPGVVYHSIIAQRDVEVPLAQSDDGLVPYWSAHLPGAASELVVPSWHSVQETSQAVLEVRRILHEELRAGGGLPTGFAGQAD